MGHLLMSRPMHGSVSQRDLEEIAYDYVQLYEARTKQMWGPDQEFIPISNRIVPSRPSFEEFALKQEMQRRVGPDRTNQLISNARNVLRLMGG